MYDEVFCINTEGNMKVIGYADDLGIIMTANDKEVKETRIILERRMSHNRI